MTLEELVASAREHGFDDLDSISKLARSAVSFQATEENGRHAATSRMGGLPALPATVPWPRNQDRSLAFIAQIELSSLPRAAAPEGFPAEGRLLFFYDVEQGTWGFDPKDAGSFAVIHVPGAGSRDAEWPADLPEHARFEVSPLALEETMTLPAWDGVLIEDLQLSTDQMEAYQNLLDEVSGDDDPWTYRGLIGGHPDQIQNDMSLECALVSAGLYCGDATAYENPRLPDFRKQARDWRLLLQVPSVESAGMMWGDGGCLYYWMKEEDLRARRFERVWMILQCT